MRVLVSRLWVCFIISFPQLRFLISFFSLYNNNKLTNRDGQIERLDEQRRQLVLSHERYVEELTSDFERKLDEERQARLQLEDERGELEKELSEMQNQLEDDIDTEIENMKRVNEDKLAISRETTLKYKGENGIMKKKSVLLQVTNSIFIVG